MVPAIELSGVARTYGQRTVVAGLDLAIEPGAFFVLLGLPGAGKTTVLRLIAGLERPSAGEIRIDGRRMQDIAALRKEMVYIPQAFALIPHYSVYRNIAFPLERAKLPRRQIRTRVGEVTAMLGISGLLDRHPEALSGGEKQRVAIARGLVKRARLFLLDDPLAGLDFKLRERILDELRHFRETSQGTFVYATAAPLDALYLADRIALLHDGRCIEVGEPETIYHAPTRLQSAALVGSPPANLLDGAMIRDAVGTWCQTALFRAAMCLEDGAAMEERIVVVIRPEAIAVSKGDPQSPLAFRGKLILREDIGAEEILHLQCAAVMLRVLTPVGQVADQADGMVTAAIDATDLRIYSARTGRLLGCGIPGARNGTSA